MNAIIDTIGFLVFAVVWAALMWCDILRVSL